MDERIDRRTVLRTGLATGLTLTGAGLLPTPTNAHAAKRKAIVCSWLYSSDPAGLASLQRHLGVITHLSPTWHAMDGDLSITGHPDPTIAAIAREHGIRLIPLIKNRAFSPTVARAILASDQTRGRAADAITALVLQNSYAGINVDFEGPFSDARDSYSDFIAQLGARLHAHGKLLTVDVVAQIKPPTAYSKTSWAATYDYGPIGKASDAVMVMCYPYSVKQPGSISPLWWLRKATTLAQTQIPSRKIVIAMPFYGRHWIVNGAAATHTDLTQSHALDLLSRSGAQLKRPARDATPRFTWSDADGEHIVHFEDARSLTAKLKVVMELGVAGASFWRLGLENASQWKVIRQAL